MGLAAACLPAFGLLMIACAAAADDAVETAPAKPHLVVMKQAEIQGVVRFLADEDNKEAQASNLKIEVWTPDGQKKLAGTVTDAKGAYKLPSLDVGSYRLVVGLLTLDLKVEDPDKAAPDARKVPKTILVLIPRSLGDRGSDAPGN